ncbi:MAG: hypothetical protein AUG44_26465 [Actinobacteria bacterium 13_1_20CM_3_71_11]|nr:MAG: hypothetical protein AUG44_26465 [Actinobacteria bacterium 13_1_20CM_3_71_11]
MGPPPLRPVNSVTGGAPAYRHGVHCAGENSAGRTRLGGRALAGALALVDRYQATVAAYPDLAERLQPLLADHQAHVDALRRAMGTPSPTASPSAGGSAAPGVADDPAAAVVALRAAEQAGQADASTACLAAAAEHAALLGSIAACRATHVEVLT